MSYIHVKKAGNGWVIEATGRGAMVASTPHEASVILLNIMKIIEREAEEKEEEDTNIQ